MEDPTARVMKEDTFRVGAGEVFPYRYFYGAMGLLKGLEVDGKVTEVIGVKALSANYGDEKDKSIDLKYQFLSEDISPWALGTGASGRNPLSCRPPISSALRYSTIHGNGRRKPGPSGASSFPRPRNTPS